MTNEPLVPSSALEPIHEELLRRIEQLDGVYVITPDAAGDALARALLFERWPELVTPPVDATRALYNRYYWLCRYATLSQREHGPDAGLEQGLFHVIAKTDLDLDFNLLEEIDRRARSGDLP